MLFIGDFFGNWTREETEASSTRVDRQIFLGKGKIEGERSGRRSKF